MVAQYGTKTTKNFGDSAEWSGGSHCYLPSIKFYGKNEQTGTPTPDKPLTIKELSAFYLSNSGANIILPNLCGIGEYKDEWDYVTGKGQRYICKVVLDGVTKGLKVLAVYFNSTYENYYAVIRTDYMAFRDANGGRILSTHFKSEWALSPGNVYVTGTGNHLNRQFYFVHTDQTLDTVDKWNAWLKEQYDAGTPVTFYYALAEPQPFNERPDAYTPIPNDSGKIWFGDGTIADMPFEVSYITHS